MCAGPLVWTARGSCARAIFRRGSERFGLGLEPCGETVGEGLRSLQAPEGVVVFSKLCSRSTRAGLMACVVACVVFPTDPAVGAKPEGGARYYGFEDANPFTLTPNSLVARLQVVRGGRRFSSGGAGSYVIVSVECPRDREADGSGFVERRIPLGHIGRKGGFGRFGHRGRLRYRVRGRFVAADEGTISYSASLRPRGPGNRYRPGVCRSGATRVTLYRNGQPPFRGCRVQHADTSLWAPTGRVFGQWRLVRSTSDGAEFLPVVYGCLFDTNKRVRLGAGMSDFGPEIDHPSLSGPFVGYTIEDCGGNGPCWYDIGVTDLRNGRKHRWGTAACDKSDAKAPPNEVARLEEEDNGAIAWTVAVGQGNTYREVCAADALSKRRIDVGDGIDLKSLRLSGSTLTWVKDGSARSTTLN
jgi:hypothetical protein